MDGFQMAQDQTLSKTFNLYKVRKRNLKRCRIVPNSASTLQSLGTKSAVMLMAPFKSNDLHRFSRFLTQIQENDNMNKMFQGVLQESNIGQQQALLFLDADSKTDDFATCVRTFTMSIPS